MLRKASLILICLLLVMPMSLSTAQDIGTDAQILAWVAPAPAPGRQTASQAGEIAYINGDGSITSLLALPQGTTRVTACGPNAETRDGSAFAFMSTVTFGGQERATLYLLQNAEDTLTVIEQEIDPVSCSGGAPFEFSPDGSGFAYIEYPLGVISQNLFSPEGLLHVYTTVDASLTTTFENVAAFDLTETGASFISFFKDSDGRATEVAVFVWDGIVEREVATLTAEENCYYRSAEVETLSSGQLVGLMGYTCRGSNQTTWQLYLIDPANRTSQLEATDLTMVNGTASYFVFTDTNAIYSFPNNNVVAFTVPDGVSARTARVYYAAADNLSNPLISLDRHAIMTNSTVLPYDASNHSAIASDDGRYLAVVTNTPNGDAVLNVIDFNAPNLPPIRIPLNNSGDTVSEMLFTDDGTQLYYVAGPDEGENNSLFALNLTTGSESRLKRGRYAQGVLSPDGRRMAVMNWREFDPDEPRFVTLEIVDLASTASITVYEGGDISADGNLINQSFAYPLSWRSE